MNESNFSFMKNLLPIDDEKVDLWEKEQRENGIKDRLKQSMPFGSENKNFDTFICSTDKQKKFLDICKKTSEKVKKGDFVTLCLLGTYGIGKTHLAFSMMKDVIQNGKKKRFHTYIEKGKVETESFEVGMNAKYVLIPELIERYQAAKSFLSKENLMDVIKDSIDADLIILDEVGRSFNPNLEKEVLYRVFNECWMLKRSIVVISNKKFKEFTLHVGGATMDRLKDSAIFPDLESMESYRGK